MVSGGTASASVAQTQHSVLDQSAQQLLSRTSHALHSAADAKAVQQRLTSTYGARIAWQAKATICRQIASILQQEVLSTQLQIPCQPLSCIVILTAVAWDLPDHCQWHQPISRILPENSLHTRCRLTLLLS